MEQWIIPILSFMGASFIAFGSWIFMRQEKQGNSLTSIEAKLDHIIVNQDHMKARQEQLEAQINVFVKKEVDILQDSFEKVADAILSLRVAQNPHKPKREQ